MIVYDYIKLKIKDEIMNILYLINFAGKAGTEKYVLNLINSLKGMHNCHLAYSITGPLADSVKDMNLPVFQFAMSNPLDIGAAKQLADYCRKNKIDIIHAQYPRENCIALLSKIFYYKPKVIFTSHLTLENVGTQWKILNKIFSPFNKKIISVCNYGKELLISQGCKPEKIEVIFNGMTLDVSDVSPSTIRTELGIGREFVVVTLARYMEEKGLSFFVKSLHKLKQITDQPFKCLLVGDGELYEEIKEEIKVLGMENEILQLGFRNDVNNILKGCDLFVNSAKCNEALSFAMLEAMSKALPLVATNVGGNSDIVNDETQVGILVEYGDEDAMAKAISDMMNNKEFYKKMSENAVRAVYGRFSYETMLKKTMDVYGI